MKEKKGSLLLKIFALFFKIGLFTFGGGYAMISIIEDECVEKRGWITHDEMMNLIVIAESTPGPVAINSSTYVGYRVAGMAGAVAGTLGMVLPSFIIIYIIAMFLNRFLEVPLIASAFKGIKLAVALIILDVGIKLLKKGDKKLPYTLITVAAVVIMLLINYFSWKISTIVLLLAAGAVSLIVYLCGRKGEVK